MRIGFSKNVNASDANSGKHKFFIRLATEMKTRGIKIDNKKPDVYIYLPTDKICQKAKINILRLDGLVMNTRWNYKAKNKEILKSIKHSDGIIYQGSFCKEAYNKFLKVKDNKKFKIIFNGASPDEFLPRNVKNYFLANSKWRPHKRLKDIIHSYIKALETGLKSDLLVTGDVGEKIKHPKIKYLGWKNSNELKILLSGAIASLHLTWLDWCPNSMIEAIVARCPVIYTKSGGHTEIAKNSGIGIKDKEWNFKLIDLYNPPSIDGNAVAKAMLFLEKNKSILYKERKDLDISCVCDKYLFYIKKFLK